MLVNNTELEILYHNLLDAGYVHEEALQELEKTVESDEFFNIQDWYESYSFGYKVPVEDEDPEDEAEIYGRRPQGREAPVNVFKYEAPEVDSVCRREFLKVMDTQKKEAPRMEPVTITQLVFEKMITDLDSQMKEAKTCDEAVKVLTSNGVSFSIGTSPEASVNTTLGDFSHELEGGAVIRATMGAGTIQYKILKDTLMGKDYWVQITAR